MKLRLSNTIRRGCGLMGAYLIISIAANGLWILFQFKNNRPKVEYYSPSAGLIASQWGTRRSGGSSDCSSCSGGSCAAPMYSSPEQGGITGGGGNGNYAWDAYGPPWRLTQGNTLLGTLYADGRFIDGNGNPSTCPASWYPTGFDVTKLAPKVDKASVPPSASSPTGAGEDPKLFGVATKEIDAAVQRSSTGYTITDKNGKVRDVTSSEAYKAVSGNGYATGGSPLKSLYSGYNLAIIGVDAVARQKMVAAAKAGLGAAASNVTVCEYDPKDPADLWHIEGNWNHALTHRPALAQSGAVAYFTNGIKENAKQNEVMAWSPDEVTKVVSSLRPRDGIPNHDPEKAKIDQGLFANIGWPMTAQQSWSLAIIVFGLIAAFVTKKPPVTDE